MPKYLIVFLLFCSFQRTDAQIRFFKSVKAKSISIESSQHHGSFRNEGFQKFQNEARFGSLFDSPGNDYSWFGDLEDRSFNLLINFELKDSTYYRHEFLVGIKKVNQKVQWLESYDSPATIYSGRSELMKVVVGYRFCPIKNKFVKLSIGTQVDLGVTISAFTKEVREYEVYEYFGKKGNQASIEFPALLDVRIFKGTVVYLGPSLGAGYYSQDGTGQLIFTSGFDLGFKVYL